MYIVNHRGIFFTITGVILAAALASILVFGLAPGIDFAGGTLMEVSYAGQRPDLAALKKQVSAIPLGEISLRESGVNGVTLRARSLTPAEHSAVLAALSYAGAGTTTELSYTSVGPSLGAEFANKALWALGAVIIAIVLYIAWAFRKVSRPVSSWVYGFAVIIILLHDLIIPAGFYALLGHLTGVQVDSLFVVALLALLGYSVNDTIVIFDRVREHLANNEKRNVKEAFSETVGKSINETIGRSINTSLTVVLALAVLVFFGAAATRDFALVMLVGVIAGTYSSILLAAPLLVPVAAWLERRKAR
ncbi:protein translocase subunit SecF [Patescibacteria group bacterium]|nr:protein translocase subunit SecF [Patescibacteria group bacterium]